MMAVTSEDGTQTNQKNPPAAVCVCDRNRIWTAVTVKALNPFPALVSLTADVKHTVEIQREELVCKSHIPPSCGDTALLWFPKLGTFANSEAVGCYFIKLFSTFFTHWKLTLSTWNLVSKIPEVSTLHRSKSWQKIRTGVTKRGMGSFWYCTEL